MVKNPLANAGDIQDTGLIPGSGRSPGEGNGDPLQYSCLENPMDRGAWQVTVCGVTKRQTRLSVRRDDEASKILRFTETARRMEGGLRGGGREGRDGELVFNGYSISVLLDGKFQQSVAQQPEYT